jgi:N-acetylglucosaminyl-diphospho-decaprenol L-rhamnosyltransferase
MTSEPFSPAAPVGVVIVTHNQPQLAQRSAEAVLAEVAPDSVVVVVNAPPGRPSPDLAALEEKVGHVALNENRQGYGANLNLGVRCLRAQHPYYLLLNDDAIATPGSIGKLVACLERQDSCGLVGPLIVDVQGRAVPAAFRFPTLFSEAASAIILPSNRQRRLRDRLVLADDSAKGAAVDWLLGAVLLVRAKAFAEIQGFDESYFLYSEETDFAYRLRLQGWSAYHCPEAVFTHIGGSSTTGRVHARVIGASRAQFIRTHWTRRARLLLVGCLALVYAWNALYVAVRILIAPSSARAKVRLWLDHWAARPFRSGDRLSAVFALAGQPPGQHGSQESRDPSEVAS